MTKSDHPIIDALTWRYATKKFDASKKINPEDLDTLLESIRLAPTSYGLQPFKVIVIESDKFRRLVKGACFNQSQPVDASHFLVFCAKTGISEDDVNAYMENISETRNIKKDEIDPYGKFILSSISGFSEEQFNTWNSKQIYIALGMLLQTAAQLQIDTIAMEGFSNEELDKVLSLKEQNLTSAVCCAIGYRSSDDGTQHQAKVRKSKEELFDFI